MEQHFALIKNDLVEKVIVADNDFIEIIRKDYDFIVEVTNNRPSPGDSYYETNNTFISNTIDKNEIVADSSFSHKGTQSGFEPFQTSKYAVKYENGFVVIGCKQYSGPGLLDSLHKLLIEKQPVTSHFAALDSGPTHGKFGVTWNDAKMIYEALLKVKFE